MKRFAQDQNGTLQEHEAGAFVYYDDIEDQAKRIEELMAEVDKAEECPRCRAKGYHHISCPTEVTDG